MHGSWVKKELSWNQQQSSPYSPCIVNTLVWPTPSPWLLKKRPQACKHMYTQHSSAPVTIPCSWAMKAGSLHQWSDFLIPGSGWGAMLSAYGLACGIAWNMQTCLNHRARTMGQLSHLPTSMHIISFSAHINQWLPSGHSKYPEQQTVPTLTVTLVSHMEIILLCWITPLGIQISFVSTCQLLCFLTSAKFPPW